MRVEINELKDSNLEHTIEMDRLSNRLDRLERDDTSSVLSRNNESTNSIVELESERHDFQQENSHSDVESKPVLDLAVCGDSIVKWLDINDLNPGGRNEKICIRGAKIDKIREAVRGLNNRYEIRRLAIHGGCNQVPEDTPHQVSSDIIDLLSEIKIHMPKTDVYFSAILPKVDNFFTPGINEINALVCSACNVLGITFVQHQRFSRGGVMNESLYTLSDLIHLNRSGVRQLTYDIKSSLA